MKRLAKLWLVPAAALAILVLPLAAARAQSLKPVAVVSFASVKENLADVGYLTRAAGMEDAGKSAMFFANAMTAGIDKERPSGLYVVPQSGDFHAVAFIPVSDLKVLLEVQKEILGEPKDVGNGILEVGKGRTAYIKEQAGWAFAAESKEHLTNLPADPVAVLGDLPKKYNFAAKVMVQNIPEELRRTVIDELKLGIERGLDSPGLRQGNVNREQAQQLVRTYLGLIERMIAEADQAFIGLGIDEAAKRTVLDLGFAAKDGTMLARQLALQADVKTQFAGFLLPDAAVTFSGVSKASKEFLEQYGQAMKFPREMWMKQIDDSPDFPAEKRDAAKKVMGQLFDVLEKTQQSGKSDAGAALVLLPKSIAFAMGFYVVDGPALEKALKDAVDLAKGQPDFPQVQFNAGTHGDVKLHRLTAPVPAHETEMRELIGEKLEIIVGIGPTSIYIAGGKDAEALLKKAIDRSAAEPDKAVPPGQVNVSLLPIMKFAKSVDENPIVHSIVSTLEQVGNDKITIVNTPGQRSTTTRVEIQEGVINAVGEAAKAFGAPGGRRGL